jgi:hypothetical protein
MTPQDKELYAEVKTYINTIYKKPSAYRSMAYIKEYKRRNGKFIPDHKPKNLLRWMKEEWKDVNPNKTKKSYPVFRPTKRISRRTPLTVNEIPLNVLQKQATKKQRIKGRHNLKPFLTFIDN